MALSGAPVSPAILGVDPGLTGGFVVLVDGRAVAQVRTKDIARDGWLPGVAALAADHVREWHEAHGLRLAYFERAQTRPGEGGSGALTTGIGWGLLVGAIVASGVRVEVVTPAAWRRAAGFPARSGAEGKALAKGDCVSWASQVPGLTLIYPGCRVPDQGIADAACIAYAGANLHARLGA